MPMEAAPGHCAPLGSSSPIRCSSQPPGHKANSPVLVFLSSFLDESRVAQYPRAIILSEELRETRSCGTVPCRAAVLTPPSPGFQARHLFIHDPFIYSREMLSQPCGQANEESQSPNIGSRL